MKCFYCEKDATALIDKRFGVPSELGIKLLATNRKKEWNAMERKEPHAQIGVCNTHYNEWEKVVLKAGYYEK